MDFFMICESHSEMKFVAHALICVSSGFAVGFAAETLQFSSVENYF